MKKITWWMGALVALLGLLVIIFPTFWVRLVVILLGLGAIAYGIYNIVVTKKIFDDSVFYNSILIKSVSSIVIGALAVFLPLAFAGTMWKAMMYVLAVYLIFAACLGFYSVSLLKDSGIERKRYILENLGLLAIAVVLFIISPEKFGTGIIRLLGIIALVLGIGVICLDVIASKREVVVEATVTEDEETEAAAEVTAESGESEKKE